MVALNLAYFINPIISHLVIFIVPGRKAMPAEPDNYCLKKTI